MSPNASPETVRGSGAKQAHELEEDSLLELLVAAWQHSAQPCVDLLDRVHREIDVGAEVFSFGEIDEPGEARDVGHVEDTTGAEVLRAHGPPRRRFALELGFERVEAVLGEGEEDQPENGPAVLGRRQARVRAQLVGGRPEAGFEVGEICRCHGRNVT